MSKLGSRAKAAYHIIRHGVPEPKALPFAWPSFRADKPEWHLVDFQTYVNEGFSLNTLIYSAIMYKVRATISAPLRAYRGNPDYPTPLPQEHWLTQLVEHPNEHQSGTEFQALNYVYLNVDGNVYILKDKPNYMMYSLRPDRVFIVPNKGVPAGISHFLYIPEGGSLLDGVPILPSDMIHIKLPWPNDPIEGMGYGFPPLGASAQVTDVDNLVTKFLNIFFKRGSLITGLLTYDTPIPENTADKIRDNWRKRFGGVENWDVGVLDRGGKYTRVGLTFEEMGFGELDARSETRILGPFGVPPILIGAKAGLDRSTYSNYGEARKACWEDTLLPELLLFQREYQKHLKARASFVQFDTSGVPALQKDVPKLAAAAYTLWQMGVPANQALRGCGLKLGPVPKGDEPFGGKEQEPASNLQGPRADADVDAWGMRSLSCDNCGGELKELGSNGAGPLFGCAWCGREYALELRYHEAEENKMLPAWV